MDQLAIDGFADGDSGRNISAADRILFQFTAHLHMRGLSRSGLGSSCGLEALKDTSNHRSQEGEDQDRQYDFEQDETKHGAGAEP